MQIDYYCFVMDKFGQSDYSDVKRMYKSCFFDNLEFDINVAKKLNKFAVYCKENGNFYDAEWNEINVQGKILFPRCVIADVKPLFQAIDRVGAIPFYTLEDYNISEEWFKYIKPMNREVIATTYGGFLKNFSNYKDKFGKVFLKTRRKFISCEVQGVVDMSNMFFSSVFSDDDLGNENSHEMNYTTNSNPVYVVFTNAVKGSNDHRFNFIKADEEVLVEPLLNLKKDKKYTNIPIEYRSFVVDGRFVTSRSWVPAQNVPSEVINITEQIIEAMPNHMQKSFVVDVLEYIDENGESYFDLCEINPITSSGYECGSSIFLLEEKLAEDEKYYPKYDLINEQQSE